MQSYKSIDFKETGLYIELPFNGDYLANFRHKSGNEIEILFDKGGNPVSTPNKNTDFIKNNLGYEDISPKIIPILIDEIPHIAIILPKTNTK